ncbi:MAG: hypothetical protein WKF43_16070 [Acidimicrobiales bacterium]
MTVAATIAPSVRVIVNLLAGALAGAALWGALRGTFAVPLFARVNHRGAMVPVGAGLIVALAPVAVEAVGGLFDLDVLRVAPVYLLVAFGFAALGLFDDLAAVGDGAGSPATCGPWPGVT